MLDVPINEVAKTELQNNIDEISHILFLLHDYFHRNHKKNNPLLIPKKIPPSTLPKDKTTTFPKIA